MKPQVPVSVVIVTRNRAVQLTTVSLPSLARQTHAPVQVLVWDASDDDAARDATMEMRDSIPSLGYSRAPRTGTSAQRNDAIPHCTADIILFLDDDAELYPDALAQLTAVFEADTEHRMAGCQCTLVTPPSSRPHGLLRRFATQLYHSVFLLGSFSRRQGFLASGHTTGGESLPERVAMAEAVPGEYEEGLQWMWGSCMAWRRDVFDLPGVRCDEDLQLMSPYAFLEDTMLSRQVLHATGMVLVRARAALCVHHESGGKRVDPRVFGRMYAFNYWLLWHKHVRQTPASVTAFLWSQCGLLVGFAVRDALSGRFARVRGMIDGWKAVREWRNRRMEG
jgi:GT2 family glycosyltransferase